MAKQKIVVRVTMEDAKKRTKALKIAVGEPGVISAALEGEKIVVVGDGLDSVKLTVVLRKKMGFAELVSVAAAEEKKEGKEAEDSEEKKVQPVMYPYQRVVSPHCQPQKIVVRVTMEDAKKRTKALKIAVGEPGVISAALEGEKIVVVGDGLDSVKLAVVLRKKMGFAELVSVAAAEEKKEEKKKAEVSEEKKVQPVMYPYQRVVCPHCQPVVVAYDNYYEPSCSLM